MNRRAKSPPPEPDLPAVRCGECWYAEPIDLDTCACHALPPAPVHRGEEDGFARPQVDPNDRGCRYFAFQPAGDGLVDGAARYSAYAAVDVVAPDLCFKGLRVRLGSTSSSSSLNSLARDLDADVPNVTTFSDGHAAG